MALCAVYAVYLTKTHQPEVFKPQKEYTIIQLPIRVHVVKDINVGEIKMKNFLTEKKIRKKIIPKINKILRSAGITFKIEKIYFENATAQDLKGNINIILNATEVYSYNPDKNGGGAVEKIVPKENLNYNIFNIYFVPIKAEFAAGITLFGAKDGLWASYATTFLYTKYGRESLYSIAQTGAHELLHTLCLNHTKNTLMSGGESNVNYLLEYQIKMARKQAETGKACSYINF